jgi:hypothetical protein
MFSQNKINQTEKQQSKRNRSRFHPEEDQILMQLVLKYGVEKWETVSRNIPGKNARQCRDRWYGYVSPRVSKEDWTSEDDQQLIQKINELGKKWAKILVFFPNRTDVSLKNRFQKLMRNQSKSKKLINSQNKNPDNIQTEIQQEIILGKDPFDLEESVFEWIEFVSNTKLF